MHEASQTKEATETQEKKSRARARLFYVLVRHRLSDPTTGHVPAPEFLEFENKADLRAALDDAKYAAADVRIVRGFEMTVKSKRQLTIN